MSKTDQPFSLYNASAGSGKTFTLVKEYLKIALGSPQVDHYKHLLAITFTNKAVAEMKHRIISGLVDFSREELRPKPSDLAVAIASETGMNLEELHVKSKKTLKHLLHNYSAFSVETIDSFNHRLIRTFARDLKLSPNFEVFLDLPHLLAEAVDSLINKAGENPAITKTLLDFALEKTDDDKSWDISRDIAKASKLLFDENEAAQVALLKERELQDFLDFKKFILRRKESVSGETQKLASEALDLIRENGLQFEDFLGKGYFPRHLQKLADGNFNLGFDAKWQEFSEGPLYKKSTPTPVASTIDSLAPLLIAAFFETKGMVQEIWLLNSILKNLTPLSVINLVGQEMERIQIEKNILPVARFNGLINAEIKEQPVPFVYERLGEKYRHFFIDEFQDTSLLQWENLIPLIGNALSQQIDGRPGSLLIVGDAKQSIYRWRGGLPEQFMDLCRDENPFLGSGKSIFNLETNFRSYSEIIDFNNRFFSFVANYFALPQHKLLYETGNNQKRNKKEGGYVKIEFLEKQKAAEKLESHSEKVYETIKSLKAEGRHPGEVCILTRGRKEGIFLGRYLMGKENRVISSETLLIQSSPLVQILELTLTLVVYPNHEKAKMQLMDLLHDHFSIKSEKHDFLVEFLNKPLKSISSNLNNHGIDFDFKQVFSASLFENCEYIIRQFRLNKTGDAYVLAFMDLVYEFQQHPQADLISFLDYWEANKEKASIASGEGTDAVRIMTIHKAKGLEFPIVIFPFADLDIYKTIEAKVWYPLDFEESPFRAAQVNYKIELGQYGETGAQLFHQNRSQLELDNFNLLYVTLTRAVEKLFVFAELPSEKPPQCYNQFLMEFLKKTDRWENGKTVYEFGSPENSLKQQKIEKEKTEHSVEYLSNDRQTHNLSLVERDALLWNTKTEAAIAGGNLLHETMSKIRWADDVETVFETLHKRAIHPVEDLNILKKTVGTIVSQAELKGLFEKKKKVLTEREIVASNGQLLRPDRLVFHENQAVSIIDYKTGKPEIQHPEQLLVYGRALEEMGFFVAEKILVYCSEKGITVNKV